MSPPTTPKGTPLMSFPRVSGDEPIIADPIGAVAKFSPRERG